MAAIPGTSASDTLVGTSADDTITGLGDNDRLQGGGGTDLLQGGAGSDFIWIGLTGEASAGDVYDGGAGYDQLYINTGGTVDLTGVSLVSIEELYSNATVVSMTAAQVDSLRGMDAYDIRITTGGAIDLGNVTYIGSFTRLLLSDAGNTVDFGYIAPGARVVGGAGADSVVGGYGSLRAEGGGGNDTLVGSVSGDTLEGGDGSDLLHGGFGNDALFGDKGDDTLIGGFGDDTLAGDKGSDTFVFESGFGDDVIDDFSGKDQIWLTANINNSGISNARDVAQFVSGDASHTTIRIGEDSIRLEGIGKDDFLQHLTSWVKVI
jgi:Ca2+-binding RTX toxin-like protein